MNPKVTEFLDEYNELRDRGDNHDNIARHYGIQRESLLRKLHRHNAYRPEPHERPTYQKLETLIQQQATFTTHDLPHPDRQTAVTAIKRALSRKQLKVVGTARNTHGNTRYIYTANLQATA